MGLTHRLGNRLLALLWQFGFGEIGEGLLTMWASPGWWSSEEFEDGSPDRRHARLWRRSPNSFFPARGFEAAGLEECVGDHRHQGVSM